MTLLYDTLLYFSKGGILMIFIFGVSLVAWFLGVEKLFFFNKLHAARKRFLRAVDQLIDKKQYSPTGFDPYDQLLAELEKNVSCIGCNPILLFREYLISAIPQIEKGFSTMSSWISVAPLLGLLGTVSGMIVTFRVITDYGLGNPNLTADGISVALITTQAGLTVAFPLMLFHNYLVNKSRKLTNAMIYDGEIVVKRICEGKSQQSPS
ncbi:MAG: MotA/TolQ/ExbB proton channel family protein [Fibrobacterota bacterium]